MNVSGLKGTGSISMSIFEAMLLYYSILSYCSFYSHKKPRNSIFVKIEILNEFWI